MGIVRDSYDLLKSKMTEALKIADVAIISGGSSVGERDVTLDVIRSLADSEILVHDDIPSKNNGNTQTRSFAQVIGQETLYISCWRSAENRYWSTYR